MCCKMYKKAKILIFCMIFVARAAFCQDISGKAAIRRDSFSPETVPKFNAKPKYYFNEASYRPLFQLMSGNNAAIKRSPTSCTVIRPDFYSSNFGFFCRKELQIEKTTRLPLRFRLGSLQYNDYLEQKPNVLNPFR